jgi:hypothetical protein
MYTFVPAGSNGSLIAAAGSVSASSEAGSLEYVRETWELVSQQIRQRRSPAALRSWAAENAFRPKDLPHVQQTVEPEGAAAHGADDVSCTRSITPDGFLGFSACLTRAFSRL